MKTATEMKMITDTAIHTLLQKMQEAAMNTLTNKIYPQMEKAAADGNYWVNFHVDAGIDMDTIIAELTGLGYKTTKQGRVLKISWV